MRITIVSGFFLPIPPVSGGSTEKSWYQLAREFAARGHQVTLISRRWPGFPDVEEVDGIRHVRLPGWAHSTRLLRNLLLDFLWSWRVFFALPTADIVVVNAVALPGWLGTLKPRAGKVVIMTGRMPKGQYRRYRRIARVLAASTYVRDRVIAENPSLAAVAQVRGYPIDWKLMNRKTDTIPPQEPRLITLGYVGRIHTEKGLLLLADALGILGQIAGLPGWRLMLCGPTDVARGGSGEEFSRQLREKLTQSVGAHRFALLEPQFEARALSGVYQCMDIFCYPSLAAEGETFGVAVAEAMAAGAVPVVSQLACFTDFVQDGRNGVVFDHEAADAPARLAAALARLLRETEWRHQLSRAARQTAQGYDFGPYAESLLADFTQLTAGTARTSSRP